MTTPTPAPIVIKISGAAHEASAGAAPLWAAVAALAKRPGGAIVVHGGKDAIDRQLALANKPVSRIAGLRVTPADQIDHVVAALSGVVNGAIVRALNATRARAVGLTLCDGARITAKRLTVPTGDLGHVGVVTAGDPHLLTTLLAGGYLPVIASIAAGPANEPLNVNADDAAAAVAATIRASALYFLTGAPGVLDRAGATIPRIDDTIAESLIADGTITEGMIPKVRAALDASRAAGCPVTIAGWSTPDQLAALAAASPIGTVVDPGIVEPTNRRSDQSSGHRVHA